MFKEGGVLKFREIIFRRILFSISFAIAACGGGTVDSLNGGGGDFNVTAQNIPAGASDVSIDSNIEITLSESADETTVNAYTVQLLETDGHSIIESKITYDNFSKKITIDPFMPLTFETEFHVMVTDKVRSTSASSLHITPSQWFFSTPDKPTIEAFHPAKNAIQVSPRSHILIQIGHGVNWSTVTEEQFKLYLGTEPGDFGTELPLTVEVDIETHSVYLAPIDASEEEIEFSPGQSYTYTISQDIMLTSGGSKYPGGETITFQTSGNTAFSNTIASSWDDYSYAIDKLLSGPLVVAGEAWGVVEDDWDDVNERYTVEHYDGDMYLAALDQITGDVLDVMQFGSGVPVNWNSDIAEAAYDMVTINDQIFVTGYTDGSLTSDPTKGSTRRMFVAMFNWDNIEGGFTTAPVWKDIQDISGGTLVEGYAMAVDENNTAIYIAARTDGAISGGTNMGDFDVVVYKYNVNSGGAILDWRKQLGTKAGDHVEGIAVANNMVYVTGSTLGDFNDVNNPHVGMNPFLIQLNASTGDKTATNFDFRNANPSNAFDRTAIGVAVSTTSLGTKVHVGGSQRNGNGNSAFIAAFDATTGVNEAYVAYGDGTPSDEKATAVYANNAGLVYLAITNFHKPNGVDTHGLGKILQLSGNTLLDQNKNVNAGIQANVRAIYDDGLGNMYATGFVYGHVDGVMPLGQGDAFVVKTQ